MEGIGTLLLIFMPLLYASHAVSEKTSSRQLVIRGTKTGSSVVRSPLTTGDLEGQVGRRASAQDRNVPEEGLVRGRGCFSGETSSARCRGLPGQALTSNSDKTPAIKMETMLARNIKLIYYACRIRVYDRGIASTPVSGDRRPAGRRIRQSSCSGRGFTRWHRLKVSRIQGIRRNQVRRPTDR